MVRGHGAGRIRHGQLHAVLLPDVPTRPAVLPERRAARGRRVSGVGIPRVPFTTVAMAAQPELRDRLHTGGPVQRVGNVRAVADVPEHRARPRAQRHRRRCSVRHFRAVRDAGLSGRQHVVLLPVPAARQSGGARRRRFHRVKTIVPDYKPSPAVYINYTIRKWIGYDYVEGGSAGKHYRKVDRRHKTFERFLLNYTVSLFITRVLFN